MGRGGARKGAGRKRKPPVMVACVGCGVQFGVLSGQHVRQFCSADCRRSRRPKWNDLNEEQRLERMRVYKLGVSAKRLGMSREELETIRDASGGACAICADKVAVLSLDHCHQKMRFRGFICNACNSGLGFFKDDTRRLAAAIEYLVNFALSWEVA
jgi:hypothetical protein